MAITRARIKSAFGADGSPLWISGAPDAVSWIPGDATADSSRTTLKAKDPEGYPITYSIDYLGDSSRKVYANDSSNLPPHLLHPTQITLGSADSSGNVPATYRFLHRGSTAAGAAESDGSGNNLKELLKARYIASDGLKTSILNASFQILYSENVTFNSSEPGFASTTTNTFTWAFSGANASSGGSKSSALRTGKRYMEAKITSNPASAPYTMWGFVDSAASDFGYGSTTFGGWYRNNNDFYGNTSGGWTGASGLDQYDQNDILMFAWDTDTRKGWIGLNGTWMSSLSSSDVAAGTGGHTITGSAAFSMAFAYGSGGGGSFSGDIKLGDSQCTYTPPTGFNYQ